MLAAVGALGAVSCGDDDADTADGARPELTVSAAASLKGAFEDYRRSFDDAEIRFSFAGSDELAAQIRQGAKPDVYAAANTALPRELHRAGRVRKPVVFAGNRLVIAVPSGAEGVESVADLAGDIDLVIGDEEVPVGSYTREVLGRLPGDRREAVLQNVRSEEPDALGIVGKLTQGAASAGFLYATDVAASDGQLRAIDLPESLQPRVRYAIALVTGAEHAREGKAFIDGLLEGPGRQAMERAGFEPPPG